MNMYKLSLLISLVFSVVLFADNGKRFDKVTIESSEFMDKLKQETKASSKIFAGSVAAACLYGIAHDSTEAWLCPEFFTEEVRRKRKVQC